MSKVDVLDHGFVRVVDTMGDDSAIVQAARVSYGEGTKTPSDDRSLIRYLMRHRHATPFEMPVMRFHVKCPIFVARQWVRHRTACLAGDVRVSFDLPSGPTKLRCRHDYLTIKQIYDRFQPTVNVRKDKQRNPFHKRDRIQAKLLRSYDEEFDSVYHTKIVDIWQTGERPVIKVVFSNGGILRATKDHLCLTDEGWLRLEDALKVGAKFQGLDRAAFEEAETFEPTEEQLASEVWQPVVGHEERYEVSSIGRVRTWCYSRPESGRRKTPKLKTLTKSPEGYWVVGLSCQGKTRTRFVHHLVLEAFDQAKPAGAETRHLNHCRTDNRLENLKWGSPAQNGFDRSISGCDQRLTPRYVSVVSAEDDGVEMTYDLEVSGPHHNFCAGGIIVHNSMNEVSGRYSEMLDEFYVPDVDQVRYQSTTNKQGSSDALATEHACDVIETLAEGFQNTYEDYKDLLHQNVAREQARIVLPVSTYTEFYWQANLRNIFHFLGLRVDPHAQYEIRVYANAMLEMVRNRFPIATEAFEDYALYAMTLSVQEQEVLGSLLRKDATPKEFLKGREHLEFTDKVKKLLSLH